MVDNIERYEDGSAAFVSAREVPWHRLGTVTPGALTAAEAAKIAHLAGWDVRKVPMVTAGESYADTGNSVPKMSATVRTNPVTGLTNVLGVVGERYQVIQNEEAFEVLDAIVDESGAHFETAGALGNGSRVFMSMKMPEGLQIGSEDAHDVYLLAYNSHDGTSAFTLAVTPVRVVCQNTLTMGLAAAKQTWTLRHTANVAGRVQEARESLRLTFDYMDAFGAELSGLLAQEMETDVFRALVKDLMPVAEGTGKGWTERITRQQESIVSLFKTAETNEFGRGTKYAAYNAITEYADWLMPVRGADLDGSKRAARAMTAPTVQAFKNRGLALVRSA